MWIEKTLLKRRAASRDAAVRKEAVSAMTAEDFRELLLKIAADDPAPEVRYAAMERLEKQEDLERLKAAEPDPENRRLLERRLDLLYQKEVLAAEMRDGEVGNALDRIAAPDVLLETALRAASVNLVLAVGGKLSADRERTLRLLCNLTHDAAALELYRNLGLPPEFEEELSRSARSAALREAAAAAGARRREDALRRRKLLALVERAEQLEFAPDAAEWENLARQWSEAECGDEALKTRFMAAKYRHFQALENHLAAVRNLERDRTLAMHIVQEFAATAGAGNWNGCAALAADWRQNKLDDAPGAAEFRGQFHKFLEQFEAQRSARLAAEQAALALAHRVLNDFSGAAEQGLLPEPALRRSALQELEDAEKTLEAVPAEWVDLKEKIMRLERDFRRRAHEENQVRDLARWEHYTAKMDICLALEKLAAADGDLVRTARNFRILRERWKAVGPVPQEKFEDMQARYRAVCTALHERLEAYFAARDRQFREAETAKSAICQEAENLSGSEDWENTSERLKALQAQWKSLPAAPPARERELFDRFHTACDAFFVRRNSAWEARKRAFLAAAARKRELCEKAEALREQPFAAARRAIADLREEWRRIPSAGRDDRTLSGEFNRIIDEIFAAHRETEDAARRRSEIVCTALLELLEKTELRQLPLEEIERKLTENQREWEAVGRRPAPDAARRRAAALSKLSVLLARLRHEAARNLLEETLHLEEFAVPDLSDEKLQNHLERREAVCRELEERLRECRVLNDGTDLAGELTLAITGNFGGRQFALTTAELDEFLRRFVVIGPVPAAARDELFARFGGLYRRALDFLEREGRECADGDEQN